MCEATRYTASYWGFCWPRGNSKRGTVLSDLVIKLKAENDEKLPMLVNHKQESPILIAKSIGLTLIINNYLGATRTKVKMVINEWCYEL